MTAKTQKSSPKAEAAFAPMTQIMDQLKAVQDKIQVPQSAREFVIRNAEAATVRVGDAEAAAKNAATSVEKALVTVVGAGATASRALVDATVANATMTLGAVKTIAGAQSLSEAGQAYVTYLRAYAEANVARAQDAVKVAQTVATDGAKFVQEQVGQILPMFRKAA